MRHWAGAGSRHVVDAGAGAYQPTHIYEVPWTGNGQRIVAQLHDGNFANNTGSLMLTILAYQ